MTQRNGMTQRFKHETMSFDEDTPGSGPVIGSQSGIPYEIFNEEIPLDQISQISIQHELRAFRETIRAELRKTNELVQSTKTPETRWIQNLRHPAYQLSMPIPIVIENDIDVVIATYDDIDLYGTGDDVQEAISDLCTAIVEYYEGLKENENRLGNIPTQEYAFLKQIIVEAQ